MTPFLTSEGLHKHVVTLFGLCNAPVTFQRLMNLTVADFINEFITINQDDILVNSETY